MNYWKTYAYINDGRVENFAVFRPEDGAPKAFELARIFCNNPNAIAVDVTQYPVDIGDRYDGTRFTRVIGGRTVEIEYYPTDEEQIESHARELANHESAIEEIITAITPI